MAIAKGIFKMNGAFGTASCYSLPGSDQMIIRTKGGPSKRRMKVGPEFETVRKHQSEWKACVMFSRAMKYAMGDVYNLADYNVSPVWNGLAKNIIKTDTEHLLGQRSLRVSEYRDELRGFSLNRNYPLNAVLAVLPEIKIDKENLSASVVIAGINTANDLLNVRKLPYFRLVMSFGFISDIHYVAQDTGGIYVSDLNQANGLNKSCVTEWFSAQDNLPEIKLELQFRDTYQSMVVQNLTCILSLGVEFGTVGFASKIDPVKYSGAGKIMAVK